MSRLFTWIKALAEGWKIFFGLTGMVVVISTVAVKLDHVKNARVNTDVRIEQWIKYDSLDRIDNEEFRLFLQYNLKNISDSLRNLNESMRDISSSQSKLRRYMMNKAATKNDVLDILKIWDNNEKKNSGLSSLRIQSIPDISSTQ